jgi:phosphoserine phosphatase
MGFLNPETHRVDYHSGGQGPILHFHAADGACEWHKPTSFPVGIMDIDTEQESAHLQLEPGDILALISDGIYEYANPESEEFGEEGVAAIFRENHHLPMATLSSLLIQAAMEFGGDAPQADDITLVLVRRLTAKEAASGPVGGTE